MWLGGTSMLRAVVARDVVLKKMRCWHLGTCRNPFVADVSNPEILSIYCPSFSHLARSHVTQNFIWHASFLFMFRTPSSTHEEDNIFQHDL